MDDGGFVPHVGYGESTPFRDGQDLIQMVADQRKNAVNSQLEGTFDE